MHILPHPVAVPGVLAGSDTGAVLARALAPLLYVQRDEWFPLQRVVAVLHAKRPLIAYHLLRQDDANGSWIPFTVPTDEEVVWVGYDSSKAPTDIWTCWHGTLLHADWRDHAGRYDVQRGKHGSLPHGLIESDLSSIKNDFYAFTWLSLPDIWLGDLTRRGPWCFCHGYSRYREFCREMPLGTRINALVRGGMPETPLARYSAGPIRERHPGRQ